MKNYDVENGTTVADASGKVIVTFDSNVEDKSKFEALMFDETNDAFVLVLQNNVFTTIKQDVAQKILDAVYSNTAQIYRHLNNKCTRYFYIITDANAKEGTFEGYKINLFGSAASNTNITYVKNEKEYDVSNSLTNELLKQIREKLSLNPTDKPLNLITVHDSLIEGCAVPEEGDKFFNLKTNSLLTTKTDVKTYDELILDGKLTRAAKILDAVTADGIYYVNSSAYYRVDGTSLTNITSVTSVVTEYPAESGVVAEEGKYYIVGSKIYALAEDAVTGYDLNVVEDGTYPAVKANNFYRFINSPVTEHPEIKLNTLYACKDGSSLVEIPEASVSSPASIPVKEVAVNGHYYVKSNECKLFTAGSYVNMGTINPTESVPDVTSPVFVKNRFFFNTTSKKLSYQIGDAPKVELTEETDFTFVNDIPPYFVNTKKLPVDGATYVLIKRIKEQNYYSAWTYSAETGKYTEVKF